MELVFLGTSSMIPTKERNQVSVLVRLKNYDILVDCGEGTQRQFKFAKINPNRIKKILITHWHGDHTLGLSGLIQTLGATNFKGTLEIYGPKGTKKHLSYISKAFIFEQRIDIKVKEVTKGIISKDDDIIINALPLQHPAPCLGFSIKEQDKRRIKVPVIKRLGIPNGPLLGKLQEGKSITWKGKKVLPKDAAYIVEGKKVSFVSDTELCDNCFKIADNSDILVCEATFTSELEEKAVDYQHLTAKQAASIANQSDSKQLIITHFSQRYKSISELEEDAKDLFSNTRAAFDFMKIKL